MTEERLNPQMEIVMVNGIRVLISPGDTNNRWVSTFIIQCHLQIHTVKVLVMVSKIIEYSSNVFFTIAASVRDKNFPQGFHLICQMN